MSIIDAHALSNMPLKAGRKPDPKTSGTLLVHFKRSKPGRPRTSQQNEDVLLSVPSPAQTRSKRNTERVNVPIGADFNEEGEENESISEEGEETPTTELV